MARQDAAKELYHPQAHTRGGPHVEGLLSHLTVDLIKLLHSQLLLNGGYEVLHLQRDSGQTCSVEKGCIIAKGVMQVHGEGGCEERSGIERGKENVNVRERGAL